MGEHLCVMGGGKLPEKAELQERHRSWCPRGVKTTCPPHHPQVAPASHSAMGEGAPHALQCSPELAQEAHASQEHLGHPVIKGTRARNPQNAVHMRALPAATLWLGTVHFPLWLWGPGWPVPVATLREGPGRAGRRAPEPLPQTLLPHSTSPSDWKCSSLL